MKIAQCPKCQGMCFLAEVNGIKSGVSAVDRQEAVRALLDGRSLYLVRRVDGRPTGLQYASQRLLSSLDDQTQVYADHPCLARSGPGSAGVPLRHLRPLRSEPVAPCTDPALRGRQRPQRIGSQPFLEGVCNGKSCQGCDPVPF